MKKLNTIKIVKICIIITLTLLIILLGLKSVIIREIFYLIVTSFLISYAIRPLHLRMVERGVNKRLSAIILISVIVLAVIAALAFMIPSILKESLNITSTLDRFQEFADRFYERIKIFRNNKTFYVILDDINDKLDRTTKNLVGKIMNSVLNIGENILSLLVVPIIAYYFLVDGDRIGNLVLIIFPVKLRNIAKKIILDIDKVMGRYIVSQLFLCIIIGSITFIILLFLHVDFPILLSLINAFFNIIPYFGPIFGAVPAIIMALIESPKTALYAIICLYLLQLVEGNILSPKITGESVSMHPLSVILLLIIGDKIGGFLGMVLAVPVGVTFKIIYEDINYYMF